MSKYTNHSDNNDSVCPYCGNSYQVEAEDYDDKEQEIICEECDKKYWLCQEFSVTHRTKPDCELNGAKHVYWPSQSGWAVKFCKVCDHCRVGRK